MGNTWLFLSNVFFNDHVSALENVIIWVNCIGAILAAYFHYQASHKGVSVFRKTHFLIAGLAVVYAIVYLVFLIANPPLIFWGLWVRGISMFAWLTVWIAPALLSLKAWQVLKHQVEDESKDDGVQ